MCIQRYSHFSYDKRRCGFRVRIICTATVVVGKTFSGALNALSLSDSLTLILSILFLVPSSLSLSTTPLVDLPFSPCRLLNVWEVFREVPEKRGSASTRESLIKDVEHAVGGRRRSVECTLLTGSSRLARGYAGGS